MKKRIYQATKVKNLNLLKLQKETKGKELVLSIDVAKEDFMAVIVDKHGNENKNLSPGHSRVGGNLLLSELPWIPACTSMIFL